MLWNNEPNIDGNYCRQQPGFFCGIAKVIPNQQPASPLVSGVYPIYRPAHREHRHDLKENVGVYCEQVPSY